MNNEYNMGTIESDENFVYIKVPKVEQLDKIELKEKLPEKIGIYFLFDKYNNLLYIGRTKNLRARISQHLKLNNDGRYNPERDGNSYQYATTIIPEGIVNYIKFFHCEEVDYKIAEEIYFSFYDTIFNNKSSTIVQVWNNYKEKYGK